MFCITKVTRAVQFTLPIMQNFMTKPVDDEILGVNYLNDGIEHQASQIFICDSKLTRRGDTLCLGAILYTTLESVV